MAPERLKLLRHAHALSQQDLAHALGTTQVYISLLETGRKHPSTALLAKLATYFRIEVEVLFTVPRTDGEPCASRAS